MTIPAVVGREHELAVMGAFLDRGRGVLVLEGEAGIGKTTVWQAGLEAARERRVAVLVARPAESETALPYAALADLLEPVLDGAVRAMPAPQRRALDVALMRAQGRGSTSARAVAAATLTGLRTLSEDRPVLLAVDDVQWVDEASAQAIAYAVRRLSEGDVSMLATERLGVGGGLQIPGAKRMSIGSLGPDEIARIVRDQLGLEVHRSLLHRLAERSGGNPFFALELARDGRLLDDPDAPLPPALDVLLSGRLSALSQEVRDALVVAACHSAPSAGLLIRAGVAPSALDEAIELGLLVPSAGRLRFSHPLVAAAVRARSTAERLREAHGRLARAVSDLDEQALHLARATEHPDEDVATKVERATERLRSRGAVREAGELATQAVRLTPPEHVDATRRRAVVHAGLVGALGDARRAHSLLLRIAEEAPPGAERAKVLLSAAGWNAHDTGELIRIAEAALAESGDAERPHALLALAASRSALGDFTEAARLNDLALPLAEARGDDQTLAFAFFNRGWMQWVGGQGIPEDLLLRAHALVSPTEIRPVLDIHPERILAVILLTAGEYAKARPLLVKHLKLARDHGDEAVVSELLADLGYLEGRLGDASLAAQLTDEAVELALQLHEPLALSWTMYLRARVRSLLGRLDEARADADVTIGCGFELHRIMATDVLGYVAFTLGQLDTAADHLELVVERLAAYPCREPSPVDAHHHLAEVYALRGGLERAEAVLDDLEAMARPLERTRSLAGALRVRGMIAAQRGSVGPGEELLRESLRVQARSPEPHESGRTLLLLGSILRRANRKLDSRDALEEAVRLLDACGSRVWADRARSELGRIAGRPLRTGSLTATEEEIARLVAAGKSNYEVAQALSMSPKTVEWNLSKIYRKVGVRSRTELAAKLARRRAG